MRIVVRADASRVLGVGHVMRCLTLVEALDAKAWFICSQTDGHIGDLIAARGHQVHLLADAMPAAEDAAHTAAFAAQYKASLVLVDHYKLNATWEREMPCSVMVIDDLADRPHACAVLLDQNLGRDLADYAGLVAPECVCLIGPRYALLRPEFQAVRAQSLQARAQKTPLDGSGRAHVLITMGGTDAPNATGWVLEALHQMPEICETVRISVVLGPTAPHQQAVRSALETLDCPSTLLIGTDRMASLMAEADLAIGAAGSTSWERCTVGLATITVVIAENQRPIAHALSAAGAATDVALHDTAGLSQTLTDLLRTPAVRHRMSAAAAQICDGAGAARVGETLRALETAPEVPQMRPATPDDILFVWNCRQAVQAGFGRSQTTPEDYAAHHRWMTQTLDKTDRMFWIAQDSLGTPLGYLRCDPVPHKTPAPSLWRVSLCLSADIRGKGWGARVLEHGCALAHRHGYGALLATIHSNNIASLKTFAACGFHPLTAAQAVQIGAPLAESGFVHTLRSNPTTRTSPL